MPEFVCSICKYESSQKYNVTRHIQSKHKDVECRILYTPIEYTCNTCKKNYSTKSHLTRHKKICNTIPLSPSPEIITEEIELTSWNDPNMENSEKYCRKAITKLFMSIPKMIEYIHFNEKHPENHNMCIKNYRSKEARVFNGKEWTIMKEDELIKKLITEYETMLEDFSQRNPEYEPYFIKYQQIKERDSEEKVYNDLKEEIKKLLYDKRHMVKVR